MQQLYGTIIYMEKGSVQFWNAVMSSPLLIHICQPCVILQTYASVIIWRYRQFTEIKNVPCAITNSKNWMLFSMLAKQKQAYFLKKLKPSSSAESDHQWICSSSADSTESSQMLNDAQELSEPAVDNTSKDSCKNSHNVNELLIKNSNSDFHKSKHAATFLIGFMSQIDEVSHHWQKDITTKYNDKLESESRSEKDILGMFQYFDNYLTLKCSVKHQSSVYIKLTLVLL